MYVRYQAPDLDRMEQFLMDFGLHRAHRTETTLYMRSRGSMPYAHVTDLGPERSMTFGLLANSVADLETLADECGAKVERNTEPAGGYIVRLTDPSGFDIHVLAEVEMVEPMPMREPFAGNRGNQRNRLGTVTRVVAQPSNVFRLGHVALRVVDFDGTFRFLTEKLGFKLSDSGYAGTEENVVVHFLHCGRGQEYTDHHTIAIFKRPESKIDHSAFEVLDWDDLMAGNQYLHSRDRHHQWGWDVMSKAVRCSTIGVIRSATRSSTGRTVTWSTTTMSARCRSSLPKAWRSGGRPCRPISISKGTCL